MRMGTVMIGVPIVGGSVPCLHRNQAQMAAAMTNSVELLRSSLVDILWESRGEKERGPRGFIGANKERFYCQNCWESSRGENRAQTRSPRDLWPEEQDDADVACGPHLSANEREREGRHYFWREGDGPWAVSGFGPVLCPRPFLIFFVLLFSLFMISYSFVSFAK
jgi:hypothetical protein